MTTIQWIAVVIGVGVAVIIWQLIGVNARLSRALAVLQSVDIELFRAAQDRNPYYGVCDNCGRRMTVRHVMPKDGNASDSGPEIFHCHACYWMSDSVKFGDSNKHYKDRASIRDGFAETIGPGGSSGADD